MAATATFSALPDGWGSEGDVFVRRGTITFGTYATNGVAVDKSTFGFAHSLVTLQVDSAGGYVTSWDKTNGKVKLYQQKDPGAAGGADIPLPEVGNSTDVSGTTFRFRATGR